MRKYAFPKPGINHTIQKIMIYETKNNGVFLYLYLSQKDIPSHNDLWFEYMQDAEKFSKAYFHTNEGGWVMIDDPHEGCQDDLIRPIRRCKDNSYKLHEDGVWKDIEF
ncbi:hypothetical protein [Paenibacillus nasutitermitis]|uniref:Uncharacterized protein n=1 Tax=Paenibacillus nasutitermitis TaxID=1652958 RepID=A0A917DP73_9BACL|nr:hypothetical protein [Paenibacillus nasutitermitis]GGD55951.1 hypothetical protein GCM10010911_12060 [Paenibacillus nasutitermitis]